MHNRFSPTGGNFNGMLPSPVMGAIESQVFGKRAGSSVLMSLYVSNIIAGKWKLGDANSVTPTSPNRTITIEIDGVAYYIAAKTTND